MMDTRVNYTVVGFFVVALSIAIVIIIAWLSVGLHRQDHEKYLTYIDESVSGLSKKAPVKYNGVEVGYVEEIGLRPDNPDQVRLLLAIVEGTPITNDTYAVLDTQGLTGVSYLELMGGEPGARPLRAKDDEPYPVIPSKPSLFNRIDKVIDNLGENVQEVTDRVKEMFDKKNVRAFAQVLRNLDDVTSEIKNESGRLDEIIVNIDTTFSNTAEASDKFPTLVDSLNNAAASFDKLVDELHTTNDAVKNTFVNGEAAVSAFNDELVPKASATMEQLQQVMVNVNQLTEELERNPAMLIRGRQPAAKGPGEE